MRTKMLSKLLPYRIFDKFDDISPEYLTSRGVRFLFSDVDNTLAPYEVPEPDERIRSWLDSLKDAGIRVMARKNSTSLLQVRSTETPSQTTAMPSPRVQRISVPPSQRVIFRSSDSSARASRQNTGV